MRDLIDVVNEYNQNNAGMHTYLDPFARAKQIAVAPDKKQPYPSTTPKGPTSAFTFAEKTFIKSQPRYKDAVARYQEKLKDPASSNQSANALKSEVVRLQYELRNVYRTSQQGPTDAQKLSNYVAEFPEGQLKKTLSSVARLAHNMPVEKALDHATKSRNIAPLRDMLKKQIDRALQVH
jgi:hypothetical protein